MSNFTLSSSTSSIVVTPLPHSGCTGSGTRTFTGNLKFILYQDLELEAASAEYYYSTTTKPECAASPPAQGRATGSDATVTASDWQWPGPGPARGCHCQWLWTASESDSESHCVALTAVGRVIEKNCTRLQVLLQSVLVLTNCQYSEY